MVKGLTIVIDYFAELDRFDKKYIKAPFGYPGSKFKNLSNILPHLPYTKIYVEPFGGSGAVLLNREPSTIEVFNDRFSGVTSFYKVIRNEQKCKKLIERLELTLHSREEWEDCLEWESVEDDVERAAQWYYLVNYSFNTIGRTFGRSTLSSKYAGKIFKSLKRFEDIHKRFKYVTIENLDWEKCIDDYDSPETVFYLDPPYVDSYRGTYKHEMTIEDHTRLKEKIFNIDGFVALSSYSNNFYDNCPWSEVIEYDAITTVDSGAIDGNRKGVPEGRQNKVVVEKLYIK